jgi:hypothetical protein
LPEKQMSFLVTLKESLVQGIEIYLNLEEGEISGFVTNMESENGKKDIVIFETAEGGVGFLNSLFNKNTFDGIIMKTLELLHDKDPLYKHELSAFFHQRMPLLLLLCLLLHLKQKREDVSFLFYNWQQVISLIQK